MGKYTVPIEMAVELTPVPSKQDAFTNAQPLWYPAGGFGVYGGSTVAQCLVAAQKTVPSDCIAHSLQCYFLRPADPKQPIEYHIKRTRDGKSFITRNIQASQDGGVISTATATFMRISGGANGVGKGGQLEHGRKMPTGLALPDQVKMDGNGEDGPFEFRRAEILNRESL